MVECSTVSQVLEGSGVCEATDTGAAAGLKTEALKHVGGHRKETG